MSRDTFLLVYGAVLHVASLATLAVLIGMSKVSWAEAGPIMAGLIGFGIGVPLSPTKPGNGTPPT